MSFRVEVSRQAAREIGDKYDRMCEWASPSVANRWRDRILAAVRSLQDMPRRCAEAPEAEWMGGEVRQLLYGRRRDVYRVLFEIRADVVTVLHVRHAREDDLRPDDP